MIPRLPAASFIGLVSLIMLFAPAVPQTAFANHLSDDIKWQVVFVSSFPACSNYHFQMMNKYHEITQKYFGLYEFENESYDPDCFSHRYYKNYKMPDDLDLLVLVLDENLGREELHSQKVGGVYSHVGADKTQNHAIVLCDCPNFYYSDPVWILTHELSHFVLYYLNYPFEVIEDLVHSYDDRYDQCRENYTPSCQEIVTKLRVDEMAYSFTVMPPYEPAIGAEIEQENPVSEDVVKLNKVIAKWWTEGKITDADYSNVLGFMSPNVVDSDGSYKVMFKDGPIDKGILTWDEAIGITDTERDPSRILDMVPNHFLSQEQRVYLQENISGLPEWFKQTVGWWVDGHVSDKEFIESVEYLQESGVIRPR